jgi:colanic acid/amylovoran biosynthesis glycosyltransferase
LTQSTAQTVTHLVQSFVEPSEPWLYDLVRLPGAFRPSVLCEIRKLDSEYPLSDVAPVLPRPRRFDVRWVTALANRRVGLPVGPSNYWRRALKDLVPAADVFHAHFGPCGWMAANAGLKPLVTSFYGYDATELATLKYWGRGYPELFGRSSIVVAEGPAMAERLVRLGASRDRLRVLPLVAPLHDVEWRPPRSTGPVKVVMAGRLVEKKGFHLGVEAFAKASVPESTLSIVGDGPEKPRLHSIVASHGIKHRVRFVPFLGRESYRLELCDADVLLQPSMTASNGDCEGGAPTVLLDALAVGLILVVSDHADLPFVAGPSAFIAEEGRVEHLADALQRAVGARASWGEQSLSGRSHVERQHAPTNVARLRDGIYAEAAATAE